MKFFLLSAALALGCRAALIAAAAPAAAPPAAYSAYWLTESQANRGEYIDLLISKVPIQQLSTKALLDAPVILLTTYAKDSIWNADGRPFKLVVFVKTVDGEKQSISINGKQYRYAPASLRDVVALLEKPEGALPVHRILPPVAGAEDFAKELLSRLKDQLAAEAAAGANPVQK